jgi:hypothetical protein
MALGNDRILSLLFSSSLLAACEYVEIHKAYAPRTVGLYLSSTTIPMCSTQSIISKYVWLLTRSRLQPARQSVVPASTLCSNRIWPTARWACFIICKCLFRQSDSITVLQRNVNNIFANPCFWAIAGVLLDCWISLVAMAV